MGRAAAARAEVTSAAGHPSGRGRDAFAPDVPGQLRVGATIRLAPRGAGGWIQSRTGFGVRGLHPLAASAAMENPRPLASMGPSGAVAGRAQDRCLVRRAITGSAA